MSLHKRNLLDNQKEKDRIENINSGRVKAYEGQLKTLNQGSFLSMQQQQFESNEDYLRRLEDEAVVDYDDTIDNQRANEYNVTVLKDNLKSITRDVRIVDSVLNSLKPDEIYEINRIWSKVRKTFVDIHGEYNPVLKSDDIVSVLNWV